MQAAQRASSPIVFQVARLAGVLGLVLLGAAGCDRLRPGYCERPEHCSDGEWCDLEGRVAFRQCVSGLDGGAGDQPRPVPTSGDGPDSSGQTADGNVDSADASIPCSADPQCPASKPACLDGLCVACVQDGQCTDPVRRFCAGNVCVDCRQSSPTSCANLGRVCDPTDGTCVECLEAAHCKTASKSFCAAKVCVGCQAAGAGVCKAPTGVCDPASGACVECVANSTCTEPRAAFCTGNRCVGCGMAMPQTCAMLTPGKPACAPDGVCVECNSSADCAADVNKPICVDRLCAACTTDAQCALKLPNPGVCLRHLGGRCATDAETIYVKRDAACGAAGNAATPLCTVEAALPLVSSTRNLVVVRGLIDGFAWNNPVPGGAVSIIGQSEAVLAGGVNSGVRLSGGGSVYIRGLTVSGSALPGIWADNGVTLRLDRVVIDRNPGGGILLNGARFDIRDVRVTGNGAGETGAVIWGGILVQSVPTNGPAHLERVSIVGNQQIGLTCDAPIEGIGLYARDSVGGVDIAASCRVTSCPTESATCGFSAAP